MFGSDLGPDLYIGMTNAFLKVSGKVACEILQFITEDKGTVMKSPHNLINLGPIPSSPTDLFGLSFFYNFTDFKCTYRLKIKVIVSCLTIYIFLERRKHSSLKLILFIKPAILTK